MRRTIGSSAARCLADPVGADWVLGVAGLLPFDAPPKTFNLRARLAAVVAAVVAMRLASAFTTISITVGVANTLITISLPARLHSPPSSRLATEGKPASSTAPTTRAWISPIEVSDSSEPCGSGAITAAVAPCTTSVGPTFTAGSDVICGSRDFLLRSISNGEAAGASRENELDAARDGSEVRGAAAARLGVELGDFAVSELMPLKICSTG